MEFYEFAKQVLVYGGFGAFVGLAAWTYGYWIYQLVAFIRQKVKSHKEKKAVKNQDKN